MTNPKVTKGKKVQVGTKMYHGGKIYWELRKDGWYQYINGNVSYIKLTSWDFEKSWTAMGYTMILPKEDLFDQLYEKMI